MSAKRILVVDDEEMVREAMTMTLAHLGYQVETLSSAQEALLKLAESRFDLVITDLKMPGMGGDQLAGAIKVKYPGMPVILLTGYAPVERPPGVDALLLKPFSTSELRATIVRFTANSRGSESAGETT